MWKYLLLFLFVLLFASCTSTKVDVRKVRLADTNITFGKYNFKDFNSAFRILHPEEAYNLAVTEPQKIAANALNYVTQGKYKDAADMFGNAMIEKDSLDGLWTGFPVLYYSNINYSWEKLEQYENIRNGVTDSSFVFYKDKPKFDIEFTADSAVIPIELEHSLPLIKIKINGKYYYFLVDTGCSITLLGKELANEMNVVYDSNKTTYIYTIANNKCVYAGFLPEFDIDKIKISNIPIKMTLDKDVVKVKYFFITYFRFDGIIGWDLLQRFDFTIDYKNKQLVLRKPIEKNNEIKNLFWYGVPIVKFYTNDSGYPLLFFFDTGSGVTTFDLNKFIMLGINTNNLKKQFFKTKVYGINGSVKKQGYKYFNFQCFTLADDEVSYLTVNQAFLNEGMWGKSGAIVTDGMLGSDWLKDKSVRVDMLNGIFEISE